MTRRIWIGTIPRGLGRCCNVVKKNADFAPLREILIIWRERGQDGNGEKEAKEGEVLGLPIRDCARGCNNCVHTRAQMSAMNVTKQVLFERLYLVSGMGTFGPWVNCPYAPTTQTVHSKIISRFLCNFFPQMAPHIFGHHDSPSNLAESRYPRMGWRNVDRDPQNTYRNSHCFNQSYLKQRNALCYLQHNSAHNSHTYTCTTEEVAPGLLRFKVLNMTFSKFTTSSWKLTAFNRCRLIRTFRILTKHGLKKNSKKVRLQHEAQNMHDVIDESKPARSFLRPFQYLHQHVRLALASKASPCHSTRRHWSCAPCHCYGLRLLGSSANAHRKEREKWDWLWLTAWPRLKRPPLEAFNSRKVEE